MKKLFLIISTLLVWCASEARAESFTLKVSPDDGTCLRSGSSTVTSGWFSTWQSTATPQLTIQPANGSTTNNMTVATNGLTLAAGNSTTTFSYTASVPSGYQITSMTATLTSAESTPTVTFGDQTVTTTTTGQQVTATVGSRTVDITLTSTSSNSKVTITDWTVVVDETEAVTDPGIQMSTESEQHWYYIVNAGTSSYCQGQVWYYDSAADRMKFGTKTFMADRLWSFWENPDGKLAIKNFNGVYVGTAGSGTGGSTQFGAATAANYIYTITNYGDNQFTIGDGGEVLHAQQSGSVLVRWPAAENNASLWCFEEVDASHPEAVLGLTTVEQGKVTTAIGQKNAALIRSTLTVSGLSGTIDLQAVSGKIVATNLSDVSGIRAYFASDAKELFVDPDNAMTWRTPNGTLYAEGTIQSDGTYTIAGTKALAPGTYYLWLALDIADNATEGNTVDATITSYTIDGTEQAEANGNPTYVATIFLSEGSVLMPMDNGSLYYRIPAITCSADGKRIVTLTDDRKNHNADLPYHCYVVAQYSEDGGSTWSQPVTVAGTEATGGDYGHGDASLITNRINGDIIGIMTCSTNGNGFFASTPDAPQTWKTIVSHDGGVTWETPVDHTKSLYGTGSPNENWYGGFTGSGAGLQKRDGTLVSPFVNREADADGNITQNYYNFMSKDGGLTWYVSGTSGTTAADEPKVLERNNGNLAISVRASGYNYSNYTTDDGVTWAKSAQTRFSSGISGNACDGDYLVWTSTIDGNPWNVALQTLPNNSSRMNLSIALSEDEGETFYKVKTICPRGSAYSSATVLPDGTLGVYYEESGLYGGYTMRFVRFSLNWASDGKYSFTEDAPFHPIQTKISVTTPKYGVQTLCLPYEQSVPAGMTVYECTNETVQFLDNETQRTGTVLQAFEGCTLQAFHPYVFSAEAETVFEFSRPISEWTAQELPANCEAKAGPLQGWFVNKSVPGDGTTQYGNPRNITTKGGLVFNRITKGNTLAVPAYAANYVYEAQEGEESTPDCVRILTPDEYTDGVAAPATDKNASTNVYDLSGRPVRGTVPTGIYVIDGKTVLVK